MRCCTVHPSITFSFFLWLGVLPFMGVAQEKRLADSPYEQFTLAFSSAGLGSGIGSMQPVFYVTGTEYLYTYEQNSFYGERTKEPDTLCAGTLPNQAIDSILQLIAPIEDTLIYRYDFGVLSGVTQTLYVKEEEKAITFRMHNAHDPIAKKIVGILNAHLPQDQKKLWVFELPTAD